MTDARIENLNIIDEISIVTPEQLKAIYPLTPNIVHTVFKGQQTIKDILDKKDKRILVVVGPCSIHDIEAAKEYARRLKALSDELGDSLYLVMRAYFEKPRTTVGWTGFINDPYLNDSSKVQDGLKMARELLSYIADLGLPAAGEALDIVTPQFIQDLFSWTAIGARTTESQSHRKMASGLSAVVGFKNGTDGNIDIAINALMSVKSPHNFVSINPNGHVAVVKTKGNPHSHIILRGGKEPNYSAEHIASYEESLKKANLSTDIMVDCSHANSNKSAANQAMVLEDIGEQIVNGNKSIFGLMLESNLNFGKQSIPEDLSTLKYGVSVTDECIGWDTTEAILREFAGKVAPYLKDR